MWFFILFFFNFCFQLLKKYINTQLWRVLSVIYSRCLECFGSSTTSSLSDVCQFNPAWFCKTSNELNIICQCHMKAQCVFQELGGCKNRGLGGRPVRRRVSVKPLKRACLIRYNEVNLYHNKPPIWWLHHCELCFSICSRRACVWGGEGVQWGTG